MAAHKNKRPPASADKLLSWFVKDELLDEILGDLYEYHQELAHKPSWKRRLFYWFHVLNFLRPWALKGISRTNSNYTTMFKHYFKISWRNLLRNKGYSLINIGGLAAGMTVAILIGLWINDELSFNKYHENYDTIAKIYRTSKLDQFTNSVQVPGLARVLKSEYGDFFEHVALVRARVEERVIAFGEKKFSQSGYFMQDGGPQMLTLKMKYGNQGALKEMNSIMLTSSLASKLFGDTDPVGEMVTMDATTSLQVTGVYEDLPKNSEFNEASYLAPVELYVNGWTTLNVWDNYFTYIYLQIKPGHSFEEISATIAEAMVPHVDEETAEGDPRIFLQPMSKWHLYSEFENGTPVTSQRLKTVWYNGIIGGFVLLLACINFMNLSTARSEKRAKEVGILKALGSHRSQLIQQFFGESMLVTLLAFIVAIFLVVLTLPWFNEVAAKSMVLPWASPLFWLAVLSIVGITGVLAGSYPALFLSSLDAVKVLKGTFKAGRLASLPRKLLVVIQFTVSISLIIGTLVVYQQLEYAKSRPVGYSRDGLISLRSASKEFKGKYLVLRNELKQTGMVEEIAEANYSVTDTRGWNGGFAWHGEKYEQTFNTIFVTYEYGKTVGLQFVDGRDFSRDIASDKSGIIINESAAKLFALENPVGEELTWQDRGSYTILGVVKDMVKGSPYEPTDPSVIFLGEFDMSWLYIRLNPAVSTHEALPKIQEVFARLTPSTPFDYTFADEAYALKFEEEERIGKLGFVFAGLAILISCLGLLGLSAFVAEQRIREIGIRKVLGASVAGLWQMLSKDFIVLVVISCVIAMPLAWYFMDSWLDSFVYRSAISWLVFAITGAIALLITMATVSFQALKAATANPVKSLRTE
ncbi:ABC transporter permease [uncultured Imperialibacter sp.]|uniref:ABC transporter permease n=1 Tax=uncultured Imperialibacter sp. TaxID=1672639 RepID=UPI0030D89FE3|tara:strand:- start:16535 stop:19135 length:2601 start_codon:yes stop_codon:yes gene_type:complete